MSNDIKKTASLIKLTKMSRSLVWVLPISSLLGFSMPVASTPLSVVSKTPSTTATALSHSNNVYAVDAIEESQNYELPDLGSGSGRFIEVNQHKALGMWSLQQLNGQAPLLDDAWSQGQLESMVWQINAQARNQAPLALVLINDPSINAFAIPGGVMGINIGTILEANHLDELASVMAHEVAHLSQRHYEHRGDASQKALLMQIGGLLAAIVAATADGDAATAIMMGSQTAVLNSQMAFSRSNEREADRIGMQLMARSGFDPKAMPRFFATLDQKNQLNMNKQTYLPSFIMSHPLSAERLSEAQNRARRYATVGFNQEKKEVAFDLLKWRVKVLTKQVTQTELITVAPNNYGAALALAYWYGTQGQYQQAQIVFDKLKHVTAADKSSIEVLLAITEAQVAGMQGNWNTAEQILLPYYHLYPERRDIGITLSDAWLQQGKYSEVLTLLKPLLTSKPYDLEVLFRMQHAYEIMASQTNESRLSKNNGLAAVATMNALRYRAQAELWQGHYDDALVSLKQAKKIGSAVLASNKSNPNKAIINVRPLLAIVNKDMAEAKTAKDFKP